MYKNTYRCQCAVKDKDGNTANILNIEVKADRPQTAYEALNDKMLELYDQPAKDGVFIKHYKDGSIQDIYDF